MKKIALMILASTLVGGCSLIGSNETHSFSSKCDGLEDAVVIPEGKALYRNEEGLVTLRSIDLHEEAISYNHFFLTGNGSYRVGDDDSFEFDVSVDGKRYKADLSLLDMLNEQDSPIESNEQKKDLVNRLSCLI